MKKTFIIFIICIVTSFLTACSSAGLDPKTLISPPTANKNQQEIHNLMTEKDGEIHFVYPKRGDYRSAVTMHDFTGNEQKDAIGFSLSNNNGINLSFMSLDENGDWELISAFNNTASQVDKVVFGDLNGDGVDEVIIGWGSPQSMTGAVSIYNFEDKQINEYKIDKSYNDFVVTRFQIGQSDELFLATTFVKSESEDINDIQASGLLYIFEEGPILKQSIPLNNAVVSYTDCAFKKTNLNKYVVVLEGTMAEGSMNTQIIDTISNNMVTPFAYPINVKYYNYFYRPSDLQIVSTDINSDTIIEFPQLVLQDNYDMDLAKSVNYYVDWLKFGHGNIESVVVKRTIMNSENNFMFEVDPDIKITCNEDFPSEYTVSEQIYDIQGNYTMDKALFTLKVFTSDVWADGRDGYDYLFTGVNGKIYAVDRHIAPTRVEEIEIMIDSIIQINY